jgi:prophage antirepressor-like protein
MMEKRMSDTTWKEDDPVYVPREQLPIPFFDHAVLAVRRDDGKVYLSIRDMCEALELAFTAQRRRKVCT